MYFLFARVLHVYTVHIHLRCMYCTCVRKGYFDLSPLPELCIEETVGESLAADANSLQHSITPQLVQDEMGVDHSSPLQLVGDDATHKVGCGVAWSKK